MCEAVTAFNGGKHGNRRPLHSDDTLKKVLANHIKPGRHFSRRNGEPIIMPSQDMVLGCYYLTANNIKGLLGSNYYFAHLEDVILAYNQNKIEIHTSLWVRYIDEQYHLSDLQKKIVLSDKSVIEYYDNLQIRKNSNGELLTQYLQTTTGRVILNYTIQKTLNFL